MRIPGSAGPAVETHRWSSCNVGTLHCICCSSPTPIYVKITFIANKCCCFIHGWKSLLLLVFLLRSGQLWIKLVLLYILDVLPSLSVDAVVCCLYVKLLLRYRIINYSVMDVSVRRPLSDAACSVNWILLSSLFIRLLFISCGSVISGTCLRTRTAPDRTPAISTHRGGGSAALPELMVSEDYLVVFELYRPRLDSLHRPKHSSVPFLSTKKEAKSCLIVLRFLFPWKTVLDWCEIDVQKSIGIVISSLLDRLEAASPAHYELQKLYRLL